MALDDALMRFFNGVILDTEGELIVQYINLDSFKQKGSVLSNSSMGISQYLQKATTN